MKKILVVDDDEDILHVIKHILTSKGFDIQTHSTGLNVPDIVTRYNPDLVLLDIRLPGKLGTEVCKDLKQLHNDLPIILFSAHAEEGNILSTSGADGFIRKPFEIKYLIDTIHLHVKKSA
jgi:DNA-binding response OmpR family regulator